METNFTRSEFPSRIPAPGDTLPRKKDQSDGSNSAEGDQSQCSPWAPPVAMTPRKTLQSLSGPGLSGPLGSSWRSSAQAAPPLSPVPGLLTPGTLGILCHVGFGLLGGADQEQSFPRCLSPQAPELVTSQGSASGATSGQGLVLHLRLCGEQRQTRSSAISRLPGCWRPQSKVSVPREGQRRGDAPGSSSTKDRTREPCLVD